LRRVQCALATASPADALPPRAHSHPLIAFGPGGLLVAAFPRFATRRLPPPPPLAYAPNPSAAPAPPQMVRNEHAGVSHPLVI